MNIEINSCYKCPFASDRLEDCRLADILDIKMVINTDLPKDSVHTQCPLKSDSVKIYTDRTHFIARSGIKKHRWSNNKCQKCVLERVEKSSFHYSYGITASYNYIINGVVATSCPPCEQKL